MPEARTAASSVPRPAVVPIRRAVRRYGCGHPPICLASCGSRHETPKPFLGYCAQSPGDRKLERCRLCVPDQDRERRWLAARRGAGARRGRLCPAGRADHATVVERGGNAAEQLASLTVATAGSMKRLQPGPLPALAGAPARTATSGTPCSSATARTSSSSGCNVIGGRWDSVYDGADLHRSLRRGHRPHGAVGQRLALRCRRVDRREARRLRQRPDPPAALRGLRVAPTGPRVTRTRRSGSRRSRTTGASTPRTG